MTSTCSLQVISLDGLFVQKTQSLVGTPTEIDQFSNHQEPQLQPLEDGTGEHLITQKIHGFLSETIMTKLFTEQIVPKEMTVFSDTKVELKSSSEIRLQTMIHNV